MRVAICSDIHLEFGPIELDNTDSADVLILSGDICVAKDLLNHDPYGLIPHSKSTRYHTFFQECCARFPHVIYIAGNHEHYHGDFAKTYDLLRERLGYLKNLHILDKDTFTLDGVTFVGGTLWTNMNKEDPITLNHIVGVMNDYKTIVDSNEMVYFNATVQNDKPVGMTDDEWIKAPTEVRWRTERQLRPSHFSPTKSVVDHKAMLSKIEDVYNTTAGTIVVVGHHAPSPQSTKPGYKGEFIINGAYSSDLSEFVLDHPRIKLWTHGHTHDMFDYMIGSTRIVCNPRGYIGYEDRADRFELIVVDV